MKATLQQEMKVVKTLILYVRPLFSFITNTWCGGGGAPAGLRGPPAANLSRQLKIDGGPG